MKLILDVFSDQSRHISRRCDTGWEYQAFRHWRWLQSYGLCKIQCVSDNAVRDFRNLGRRQNLEILGIPMSDNENNAVTESKVLTVLKKFDENISHDDIDISHRLGKSKTNKTPTIIVRFVSRRTRKNIYKERRILKSNAPGKPTSERAFINESLTKRNKHLFSLANEERKKINWKYTWTSNGRILLRQSNDSRVTAIRSEKDIEHIKNFMDNPRNTNYISAPQSI